MKKLKNIIAAVLLAVFSTVCFSACSKSDDGSGSGGGTGSGGGSQKTSEQVFTETIASASNHFATVSKYKQTFTSKIVREGQDDITANHANAGFESGVESITTNTTSNYTINFFDMSEGEEDYFQAYEFDGEYYFNQVFNPTTKRYKTEQLDANAKVLKVFGEARLDGDISDAIALFKEDQEKYTHTYSHKTENDVLYVSYTRTQADVDVLTIEIAVKDGALVSLTKTLLDLINNQTTIVTSTISYENCTLQFDKNAYLEQSFSGAGYVSSMKKEASSTELKNQVVNITSVTSVDGAEDVTEKYQVKYKNEYGVEKFIETMEGVETPISYYESTRITDVENLYANFRTYNITDKTYTSKDVSYEEFLTEVEITCINYSFLCEFADLVTLDEYEVSEEMIDGKIVITLQLKTGETLDGIQKYVLTFDKQKLIKAEQVVKYETETITNTYVIDYIESEISFDVSEFVEQA